MTSEATFWMPPRGTQGKVEPAGRWWDAVRVSRFLGEQVLKQLGEASGAVIEDVPRALLYWLIEPGSADDWPEMSQVTVWGTACYISVPPQSATNEPVRWRVPGEPGRYLTDVQALRHALETAR